MERAGVLIVPITPLEVLGRCGRFRLLAPLLLPILAREGQCLDVFKFTGGCHHVIRVPRSPITVS